MIYTPGRWLEGELSEQESDEILQFSNLLYDAVLKTQDMEQRFKLAELHLMKYMNSMMHLLYRLKMKDFGLHISDGKVFDRDEKEVDIMGMTMDFLFSALTEKGLSELSKGFEEVRQPQKAPIAPLGSVPNGDSLNWMYKVITASKGGRVVTGNPRNRHEKVTTYKKGDALRFVRENKQTGSSVIVEIDQADKYLSKTSKTFTKVLLFTLQKMTDQHFPLEVGFHLQELVSLGMYSTTSNAARAVKDFFAQQKLTTLSGVVKKGRKTVKEEGGVLFYHYKLDNGYVTLSVNENFNMEFIANYFTVFPRFAYALSNNAFSLVRYIFFLARQNTQSIKTTGTFRISLDAVRDNLGLPSIAEVKNRKYKQYIIDPIEKAIEEIETALQNVPEAEGCKFTITPYTEDTGNISKWLEGYLEIGLNGEFAETFIRIATKAETERDQRERLKQKELARIAARAEAKAAAGTD